MSARQPTIIETWTAAAALAAATEEIEIIAAVKPLLFHPGVLAKPWTQKRVTDLANEEIFEFICTENNRDVEHLVGK